MPYRYIILNLLLLVVVFMVAIKNYDTWSHPIELVSENRETVKKPAIKTEAPPLLGIAKEPASPQSFTLIAEKNIFSPERKDFPVLAVEKSNPVTRPQVVLYGVTIAGDYEAASITSVGRPLMKGERETLTLKVGEKIGGYKLARVHPDRITLQNTNDSFEVLLYDPKSPKKRKEAKTEIKPTGVTTPFSAATASPTPQAAAPGTAPPPASLEKAPPIASVQKAKEPAQQQIVGPASPLAAKPLPQSWQRRRGLAAYPSTSSTSGVPVQATQQGE